MKRNSLRYYELEFAHYNRKYKSKLLLIWRAYIITFFLLFFFIIFVSIGVFGTLPSIEELKNPNVSQATEIYTHDNVLLGKYYYLNRSSVKSDEISPNLINALVATEDSRFYQHFGIDVIGLFRVFVKTIILNNKNSGGGSTISQQLAKLFFPRELNLGIFDLVLKKIKEWVIAIKLEINFTKEEILTFYLNQFDFIYNAVGIKSASNVYFGKDPKDLEVDEAAVLAGMAKNPSLYNPYSRPENAEIRKKVVLNLMYQNGYITEEAKDTLSNKKININYKSLSHSDGSAPYFREFLRDYMKEWILKNKKADGTYYDIYSDGLKIYTTLDSKLQKDAELAVSEWLPELQDTFFSQWRGIRRAPFDDTSDIVDKIMDNAISHNALYLSLKEEGKKLPTIMKAMKKKERIKVFTWRGYKDTTMSQIDMIRYYKHFLHTGMMSIEPKSGKIRTWVGGINHSMFQYDHVKLGKRQVGSVFKPFVYTLAIQEGYSPCHEFANVPVSVPFGDTLWTPRNSTNQFNGEMVSLKKALAYSINYITAYIIKQFGPKAAVDLVKSLGVTADIPAVPSIALGTPDISVYEIVSAYSVFANKGVWIEPTFIERIEDKYGVIIYKPDPKKKEVLSKEVAFRMLNLLEGVVRFGSGVRLRYKYNLTGQMAGKTGTTQNHSDGWYVGIIPKLVTGIWVGCEDRIARFRNIKYGQGANMALPIWGIFTRNIYNENKLNISPEDEFERPSGVGPLEDCKNFKSNIFSPDTEIFEF